MASLRPSPVMVLTPVLGEAATTSWPPWRRMGTVFDPTRPVPPIMTIFMFSFLSLGSQCLLHSRAVGSSTFLGASCSLVHRQPHALRVHGLSTKIETAGEGECRAGMNVVTKARADEMIEPVNDAADRGTRRWERDRSAPPR